MAWIHEDTKYKEGVFKWEIKDNQTRHYFEKKKKSSSALSRRNKRPGYRFQTAEAFRQSSTHSFCLGTKPSLFPGEEKARMNRQGREGRFRMKPAADYWLPTEKRPFRTWLFSDLVAGGAVELRVTSGVLYLLSCVYFCRGQCISIRWKTVNMPSVGRVANFQKRKDQCEEKSVTSPSLILLTRQIAVNAFKLVLGICLVYKSLHVSSLLYIYATPLPYQL